MSDAPKVDRSRGTVRPPRVIRRGLTWYVVAEGADVSSHPTVEEAAEALKAYHDAAHNRVVEAARRFADEQAKANDQIVQGLGQAIGLQAKPANNLGPQSE